MAYKLNFDGSVRDGSASAGVILRDSEGNLVEAHAYNLGQAPVFVAETTTLHHGITLALRNGITNLHIEGDNLLAINGTRSPPWQIANIIKDTKVLLTALPSWSIRHIYREANRAADR